MIASFRRYFISGLLFWLPIWVTIMVVRFFLGLLDSSFSLLPAHFQPDALIGRHVPGLSIVLALLIITVSGAFVANIVGKRLVVAWDRFVHRIPLVRNIYASVKQTLDTLFKSGGQSFRQVLLVEYPRKGLWSIAFQTGQAAHEVHEHVSGEPMISIFIPTTPNPTSGFLMMIPQSEAIALSMSVEDALKFVVSLGVVQPPFLPTPGSSSASSERG